MFMSLRRGVRVGLCVHMSMWVCVLVTGCVCMLLGAWSRTTVVYGDW